MAFSESIKDLAFARSSGRCECRRTTHNHSHGRCSVTVTRHGAEYHHITSQAAGGSDSLSNCEVLCVECHQATDSYGG